MRGSEWSGVLIVVLGGAAAAQSTTTPSTGAASGPAPGGVSVTDLDLPLERPVYQGPPPGPSPARRPTPPAPPAPPAPPPTPDDPRDTPPPTIYGEEIVSENDTVVYVIDHSGSMQLDEQAFVTMDGSAGRGTRMERAKQEIARSILGLSANFRFNVVAFDCATITWRQSLVLATDGNKQSALAWVRELQPSGATGTGPATALALADRSNMLVILLTDGAPNCGVPEYDVQLAYQESSWISGHRRMISLANTQRARVNVFGIAAAGPYRQFCQDVANDSGGVYVDVP